METAALRIGCKVNLTLRITGVRPNGWHELDTVFLPLAEPSDTLRLALRPGGGWRSTARNWALIRKTTR